MKVFVMMDDEKGAVGDGKRGGPSEKGGVEAGEQNKNCKNVIYVEGLAIAPWGRGCGWFGGV